MSYDKEYCIYCVLSGWSLCEINKNIKNNNIIYFDEGINKYKTK